MALLRFRTMRGSCIHLPVSAKSLLRPPITPAKPNPQPRSTSVSRSMVMLPTDPINLMDPYATASTSRRPDWVLLHPSARISHLHNATTVVTKTRDGQPVVVNDEDDKAWVITVDMKHAVVQAVAPFSAGEIDFLPMYRPCSFPKYLNMTPGVDITNTVHKYFTRMDAEKCIGELLWTRDWLRELGQCLEHERSVYIDCSSLHFCPVSSLRFTTPAVVEYASSVGEGKAKAASKAVDVLLRALEDFNLLLRKPPSDASTSTKAMRRKINTALKALKNVLQIAPQSMMAGGTTMDGVTTLANACHQKRPKPIFERCERPGHKIEHMQPGFSDGKLFCGRGKKASHEKDKCDDERQVELNRQLELNLHGSLGPWLNSLPPDVWFILAIAFSALVRACLRYVN